MDNPIKKIFSNIKVFSGGNKGTVIGVDIGSSAIKVVELKSKGSKALLETYGSISLGPYADTDIGKVTNLPVEKIVGALKEVLGQSGVKTNKASLSIPVQSSLIFTISLPKNIKESELSSIVSTEARKYIPLPITEVSLDYFMLPQKQASFEEINTEKEKIEEGGKVEVLVVAIQNNAISKYRSIISHSNLEASFFEVEMFSSVRSNFEHELSPVLLVDLGASSTKVTIVEFGIVKSHHTVNRGGADITEAISVSLGIPFSKAEDMKKEFGLFGNPSEKTMADIIKVHTDYIFSEMNNVLLSYEKKYGRTINKIIFTGGGSTMKGLKEVAQNSFRSEIFIGHPFEKVGAPEFLKKVLDVIGGEFAVALGLALRRLQ